jgi:hypothetical protein
MADAGQSTVENGRGRPVFRVSPETSAQRRALAAGSFLGELTAMTGGQVFDGDDGGELAAAFEASLAQFRTRYEITYTPTSAQPGWHAVDLRLKGHRGATVHARRGYER